MPDIDYSINTNGMLDTLGEIDAANRELKESVGRLDTAVKRYLEYHHSDSANRLQELCHSMKLGVQAMDDSLHGGRLRLQRITERYEHGDRQGVYLLGGSSV